MLPVTLLIPIAIIVFYFLRVHFIPSSKLSWLSTSFSPVFAVLFFGVMVAATRREIRAKPKDGSLLLRSLAVTAASPLFGYFIWHMFVTGPLPYFLHLLEGPVPSTREEIVTGSFMSGRRGCRQVAHLKGGSFLFHRDVCGITADQVNLLHDGGYLMLKGTESSYGFSYEAATIPERR